MQPTDFTGPPSNGPVPSTTDDARARYAAPCLEPLGKWQALTLQQSMPLTDLRRDTESDSGMGARYGES